MWIHLINAQVYSEAPKMAQAVGVEVNTENCNQAATSFKHSGWQLPIILLPESYNFIVRSFTINCYKGCCNIGQQVRRVLKFYSDDRPSLTCIDSEHDLWKKMEKWKADSEVASELDTSEKHSDFFSNIHTLWSIMGTLPVTGVNAQSACPG